jgi:hypothetical protein
LEKSSITLKNSNLNISNLERFELFINKSENYYNEVVKKEYSRNVIVIFASKDSDFYKKALYIFPVVFTKAWSANIEFKLVDSSIE